MGSLAILGIVVIFCNRRAIKEIRAAYLERRSSMRVSHSLPTEGPPDAVLAHPANDQIDQNRIDLDKKEQQL